MQRAMPCGFSSGRSRASSRSYASSRGKIPSVRAVVSAPAADPPEVLARFHAHLEVVEIIAHKVSRMIRGAIDRDDLLSAGREGLLDAARRYDPSHQSTFVSYASLR